MWVDDGEDRVLYSSLRSLTFYAGELTRSRRNQPVQQLTCTSPNSSRRLCSRYAPDVVQCTNKDPNVTGQLPDWRCEANLPSSVRLGRVQVSCEGYSGPGDRYVLDGSCGLTYRLLPATDTSPTYPRPPSPPSDNPDGSSAVGTIFALVFWCFFIFVILVMVRGILRSCFGHRYAHYARPTNPSSNDGGGGGGPGFGPGPGPGPNDDPPPPYTARPQDSKASGQLPEGHPAGQASGSGWSNARFGGRGATFAAGAVAGAGGLTLAQRFWRWLVTPPPPSPYPAPGYGGVDEINREVDYGRGWREDFNREPQNDWFRRTHGFDSPHHYRHHHDLSPPRMPSPPRAPSPGLSTQTGFGGSVSR